MPDVHSIYRPLLKLALPLIFIQLCQASLGLVDTMVAGQYNYKDLAGIGLGSAIWTPVFILFTGIMFVMVPKLSEMNAANDYHQMIGVFHSAQRLAAFLSVIGFVLVHVFAFSVSWMVADPDVASVTKSYLHFIAFGIPAMVYILLYRFSCEGSSRLTPIIKVFVTLLVINTLLNFLFVFGIADMRGIGGAGCGLATTLSAYLVLFVMKKLAKQALPWLHLQANVKADRLQTKALLLDGIPIGVAFIVEVLALTALAFLASSLGVKEVAAHQIAINIAMVVFMIPLALSSATTIQIAYFSQADMRNARKQTVSAAVLMAMIYGLIMAIIIIFFGKTILLAFSEDKGTLFLATGLLIYIALFQFFDAIQIVAAGILRGLQQFLTPMLVILVTYWLLVVPSSYLIINSQWNQGFGINTIWLLLSSGIAIAAISLFMIIYKQVFSHPSQNTSNQTEH